jgi:hypothetical protein
MARTAVPTSTTNDLVTAAWFNTYLRDNEAAHWAAIADLQDKPLCVMSRTTDWNTTSTLAAVTLENEIKDTDDMWGAGAPTRIYFPKNGFYDVSYFVDWASGGTAGDYRVASVFRNGSTTEANKIAMSFVPSFGATAVPAVSGSICWYFVAGDYIELKVQAAATISTNTACISVEWSRA